jgi:hypothetical protein
MTLWGKHRGVIPKPNARVPKMVPARSVPATPLFTAYIPANNFGEPTREQRLIRIPPRIRPFPDHDSDDNKVHLSLLDVDQGEHPDLDPRFIVPNGTQNQER